MISNITCSYISTSGITSTSSNSSIINGAPLLFGLTPLLALGLTRYWPLITMHFMISTINSSSGSTSSTSCTSSTRSTSGIISIAPRL